MTEVVTVEGLGRVTKDLSRIASRLPRVAQEAAVGMAELAATRARATAPSRTGRLRRSISVTKTAATAAVEASAPYGRYVEYGTKKEQANPFLARAVEETAGERRQLLSREMDGLFRGGGV